ncbi:hypothetical protein BV22DRAFT_490737 [Leucogyrophana mollusca]|uniref:Uncharacterized protein n=1 Tax=Leucogyrophana mollusca TaxID=85980 RepID=A0ACB8BFX5_9AGAM|nr:hypothetical protein BV22DRAFT_490737 [Leucogyrophana mollusca]
MNNISQSNSSTCSDKFQSSPPVLSVNDTSSEDPLSHLKSILGIKNPDRPVELRRDAPHISPLGSRATGSSLETEGELIYRSLVDIVTSQGHSDEINVSLPSASSHQARYSKSWRTPKGAMSNARAETSRTQEHRTFELHNPHLDHAPLPYLPSERAMKLPTPMNPSQSWSRSRAINDDSWRARPPTYCHAADNHRAPLPTLATTSSPTGSHQTQESPREYCRAFVRGCCRRQPCPYVHRDSPNDTAARLQCDSRNSQSDPPLGIRRGTQRIPPGTTVTAKPAAAQPDAAQPAAAPTTELQLQGGQPFTKAKQKAPEPPLTVTLSNHTKVKFSEGFEVQDIITGFETRWVHLGNVASNTLPRTLNRILAPFGQIDALQVPEHSSAKVITVKVQFSTAAEAMEAAVKLNGFEFANKRLTAKLPINNSGRGNATLNDTSVRIEWEAPYRLGYAGYATLDEAKKAVEMANDHTIQNYVVTAALYDGLPAVGAYNVIFRNLPPTTSQKEIEKYGPAESIMLEKPNYTSIDNAVKCIKKMLDECGEILRFDLVPPPFRDGVVKAWVDFASPHEAQVALEYLDGRRPVALGRTQISVRHLQTVSYPLPRSAYDKLQGDIARLRWSWQWRYRNAVTVVDRAAHQGAGVFIKLTAEDITQLSQLKLEFERLLRGELVVVDKKPVWDGFFARPCGYAYIKELERRYDGIQVQGDLTRRTITLFGPIAKRQYVRREIVKRYEALKAQQFWEIPLTGRLIGLFLCSDLIKLQQDLGEENCILDLGKRNLVIRGNEQTFQLACKVVRNAQKRHVDERRKSTVICPVCLSEPVFPTTLDCGHQWCQSCLSGYLVAAKDNKLFPLSCLGNDASCTHRISLSVAQKLLSAEDFEAITETSFWKYVHSRPEEFHHCPTPDCTQVYRSAPQDVVLQCPSCLIRICPACHVEYHDGLTCEERDVADDKLFTEWAESHDVKSCPGCKATIERAEGCNHMTCTRCQTHICWECLATFPKGEGIYDHMRTYHGGIGL